MEEKNIVKMGYDFVKKVKEKSKTKLKFAINIFNEEEGVTEKKNLKVTVSKIGKDLHIEHETFKDRDGNVYCVKELWD